MHSEQLPVAPRRTVSPACRTIPVVVRQLPTGWLTCRLRHMCALLGRLPLLPLQVADCRALAAIPEHHIMLTGERSGGIKIFQWKG